MHTTILNTDVDGVLFLIGIEVNVNSPIQDGSLRTPLHLAIPSGSEVVVRHLVSTNLGSIVFCCVLIQTAKVTQSRNPASSLLRHLFMSHTCMVSRSLIHTRLAIKMIFFFFFFSGLC